MIVVLHPNASEEKVKELHTWLESYNVKIAPINGVHKSVFGLIGDTSKIDINAIRAYDIVDTVTRVQEPYKNANRKMHPEDTVIDVNGIKIGGGNFAVIAGPCSVESEHQIIEVAQRVKAAGANFLRGGAFKPRTSPYTFQGLRAEGIELLLEAKKVTGLPIVTEIMSLSHLDLFADVDVIQVGARNMQNFELLKELGHCKKPILLKRGLANTIEELLMSAEYITAGGNTNIILCERGIRTFEPTTRNTLDISAVPILKKLSHFPVIVDPSHASGITWLVEPLSKSAIAAGCDGLIIEVHDNPKAALSDGAQSLNPDEFDGVMSSLKKYIQAENKVM